MLICLNFSCIAYLSQKNFSFQKVKKTFLTRWVEKNVFDLYFCYVPVTEIKKRSLRIFLLYKKKNKIKSKLFHGDENVLDICYKF